MNFYTRIKTVPMPHDYGNGYFRDGHFEAVDACAKIAIQADARIEQLESYVRDTVDADEITAPHRERGRQLIERAEGGQT